MRRWLTIALVGLALAGCVQGFTLVSGERAKVHGGLSVAPDGVWNRLEQGNNEVWTLDGPALQQLRFVVGVADGEAVMVRPPSTLNNPQADLPKFHANMTPFEVAELLAATLTRTGVANMQIKGLKPAKFGEEDGFRFEMSYTTSAGLEVLGFAVGRIKDKKLYLVSHSAPKLYFFERDRGRAERMIASLRFET